MDKNNRNIKTLYIIRHGETDLNKRGIVQGRGIDADLNDTGRAQAEAFYQAYKDVPFEKIYTSTLKRTHQTVAKFIDKEGLAWEQLSGLDELAWGKYEGQESNSQLRSAFEELVLAWNSGSYDVKPEGGESPNDVYIRQASAMEHIISHKEEKLVLVCMHGRAMRLLMCLLLKKPLLHMDEFPHQNTSLYVVEYDYDSKTYSIENFNSLDHLK